MLKAGDVVVLKSGSPKMTIKFIEEEYSGNLSLFSIHAGEACCEWFDMKSNKSKCEFYRPDSLKLCD